ncbi:MAG: hypothetical protein AB2L20_12155 [Mangrovibacterium sp.]
MTGIITRTLLIIVITLILFLKDTHAKSWICYQLIHTEVDNTLKEYGRQKKIKANQELVGAQEKINKEKTGFFQEQYEKIRSGLNSVGMLIEAGVLSLQAYPVLQEIRKTQSDIIDVVSNSPSLAFLAFESEAELTDKALSVIRFMTGIVISYGDINQMKPSDRKMILNHAMSELQAINSNSYLLLSFLRRAKRQQDMGNAEFADWINEDQKIIRDILIKAKAI